LRGRDKGAMKIMYNINLIGIVIMNPPSYKTYILIK
jgi:hypothetical protein